MKSESEFPTTSHVVLCFGLALALILLALAGCGANVKRTTLNAALVTLDATKAALEVYDREHQEKLVEDSESKVELLYSISRYRTRRQAVLDTMIVVYKMIAVAALNPTDINVGEVLKLLQELKNAIEEFKQYKEPEPKDEDDEPTISRRTVLVEASCPRPSGTLSSFSPPGRRFGASSPASATSRFLMTPRSRPAWQPSL